MLNHLEAVSISVERLPRPILVRGNDVSVLEVVGFASGSAYVRFAATFHPVAVGLL